MVEMENLFGELGYFSPLGCQRTDRRNREVDIKL
jgi:hypothetical protein